MDSKCIDYLLFRDGVEGPDVILQDHSSEGRRQWRVWNYLLFRDGVEKPDVVLQGDSGKIVDGGGESGEGGITFCSGTV